MIDYCFEFIQIAIGVRNTLSGSVNDSDWQRIFNFCRKQALVGIGFTAVERLHSTGIICPSNLRMKWYAMVLQIEKKNILLNIQCKELTKRLNHDGFDCCILKGQGNLPNYPDAIRMRRQCGDIDLWIVPFNYVGLKINDAGIDIAIQIEKNNVEYVTYHGVRAVIEYVKQQYRLQCVHSNPRLSYHHIKAPKVDGTEVEMHYRPSFLCSPIRNMRMQRWFKEQFDVCLKNKCQLGFPVLTSSVNVVYQLVHLYRHVFEGGIGLRQLMDYYFALRVWHNDVMECKDLQSQGMWSEGLGTPVMSKEEVMAVLRSFGMAKFSAAVMYVLQEAFENEECQCQPWMICEPNEVEGRKLLEEIMQGGNFGQYDTRDAKLKKGGMVKHGVWKLKRVMRLVSSYPEEALWEPVFRVWHLLWRIANR